MAIYSSSDFTDERIELDGNEFIRCTFVRCTLIYRATGPVALDNNSLDRDCRVEFADAAADTIGLLEGMYFGGLGRFVDETIANLESKRPCPPPGRLQRNTQ